MSVEILKSDAPEVIAHLQMLQGVVNRMAGNSALCKTLCMTLVAGIVAFAAAVKRGDLVLLAAIPVILFCYLDCLYLSLEKSYRNAYNLFVDKLHRGLIGPREVYDLRPDPWYGKVWALACAFCSWSVWPVYIPLLAVLFLIRHLYS